MRLPVVSRTWSPAGRARSHPAGNWSTRSRPTSRRAPPSGWPTRRPVAGKPRAERNHDRATGPLRRRLVGGEARRRGRGDRQAGAALSGEDSRSRGDRAGGAEGRCGVRNGESRGVREAARRAHDASGDTPKVSRCARAGADRGDRGGHRGATEEVVPRARKLAARVTTESKPTKRPMTMPLLTSRLKPARVAGLLAASLVLLVAACTPDKPPEALRSVRTAEVRYDRAQETN